MIEPNCLAVIRPSIHGMDPTERKAIGVHVTVRQPTGRENPLCGCPLWAVDGLPPPFVGEATECALMRIDGHEEVESEKEVEA